MGESEPEWDIKMGSANHRGMKVTIPGGAQTPFDHLVVEDNTRAGTLRGPKTIGILAYDKVNNRARFFLLEYDPTADLDEIGFEEFFVSGRFRVREKINHTNRAREAYRALRATGAADEKSDG